ncbi:LacI family DNA-binding transcriptional regulator [Ancylobacter novellus]|nr:LacI family DNA-binding transcriptional regulator [Ancylobacter novellus]
MPNQVIGEATLLHEFVFMLEILQPMGTWREGHRRMNTNSQPATSRDIARLAKVSQATVSRVLSGHPSVQPETRDRVLAAVRQLNYRPNGMARAMRTNRTGNIGVVVSRLANPLYPQMLQILGQHLAEAGLRMMVWSTSEADEMNALSAARESLVDGIIMTTATTNSSQLYDALKLNVPVVLINRVVEGWPCDQLSSDNYDGGRQVADYLVKAGRRRLGLIGGPAVASTIRDRLAGFRDGLASLGVALDPGCCVDAPMFSHQNGFAAASALLDLADAPDAIFCVNDVLALGACDAARTRGLNVPNDFWLVGYDDIEMSAWPAFDLTTVRQPLTRMTADAVSLLQDRITGVMREHSIKVLPNDLMVRGSTAGFRPAA